MGNEFHGYCRTCGYPLGGLPDRRCPECGQEFDPSDSHTFDPDLQTHTWRRRRELLRPLFSPLLIIPFIWVGFAMGPLVSLATIVGLAAIAFQLLNKRWIGAAVLAIGSPLTVFFGWGAVDYLRGVGAIRFHGLPSIEAYNIDREYRCERRGGGCLVDGSEWITDGAYNAGFVTAISILGPMRGSYVGPYPSEAECRESLQHAEPVAVRNLLGDNVTVENQKIALDAGVGAALLRATLWYFVPSDPTIEPELLKDVGPIQVALCQGVPVLRIPDYERESGRRGDSDLIILIDSAVGRPFAYFGSGRDPPSARWRK